MERQRPSQIKSKYLTQLPSAPISTGDPQVEHFLPRRPNSPHPVPRSATHSGLRRRCHSFHHRHGGGAPQRHDRHHWPLALRVFAPLRRRRPAHRPRRRRISTTWEPPATPPATHRAPPRLQDQPVLRSRQPSRHGPCPRLADPPSARKASDTSFLSSRRRSLPLARHRRRIAQHGLAQRLQHRRGALSLLGFAAKPEFQLHSLCQPDNAPAHPDLPRQRQQTPDTAMRIAAMAADTSALPLQTSSSTSSGYRRYGHNEAERPGCSARAARHHGAPVPYQLYANPSRLDPAPEAKAVQELSHRPDRSPSPGEAQAQALQTPRILEALQQQQAQRSRRQTHHRHLCGASPRARTPLQRLLHRSTFTPRFRSSTSSASRWTKASASCTGSAHLTLTQGTPGARTHSAAPSINAALIIQSTWIKVRPTRPLDHVTGQQARFEVHNCTRGGRAQASSTVVPQLSRSPRSLGSSVRRLRQRSSNDHRSIHRRRHPDGVPLRRREMFLRHGYDKPGSRHCTTWTISPTRSQRQHGHRPTLKLGGVAFISCAARPSAPGANH